MSSNKIGLVLSGGGAKGAYQVGVLKALSEMHINFDVISGASIGALNGAVLACAPTVEEGITRLETLWMDLAEKSPLQTQLHLPVYLELLLASGQQLLGLASIHRFAEFLQSLSNSNFLTAKLTEFLQAFDLLGFVNNKGGGIFSDSPLRHHLDQYLKFDDLISGTPLYVSLYKYGEPFFDLLTVAAAELGIKDTRPADFVHLQSLPANEQREALLASAAIPYLFAPRNVNGSYFSDGGQGGWAKMQGNTPIDPLIDAGCKTIIVTHLSDGSLWSRHDFPGVTIMEIRPQSDIAREGLLKDLLGFNSEKIPSWIEQGYNDTKHCIGRILKSVSAVNKLRLSTDAISNSGSSAQLDEAMNDAMQFLK